MNLWERISPSHVSKDSFRSVMRLSYTIGAGAGFLLFYSRSISNGYQIHTTEVKTHTLNRSVLRNRREQARGGDGYAGNG